MNLCSSDNCYATASPWYIWVGFLLEIETYFIAKISNNLLYKTVLAFFKIALRLRDRHHFLRGLLKFKVFSTFNFERDFTKILFGKVGNGFFSSLHPNSREINLTRNWLTKSWCDLIKTNQTYLTKSTN